MTGNECRVPGFDAAENAINEERPGTILRCPLNLCNLWMA